MKLKKLIITFFLLPTTFGYAQTQSTQIVAHRGFWKTNGSAQNSIAALMKADSVGCYGSEFDVWLTDDDQLVVNWSSVFKGVNMQESTVKECTAIVLDNGEHLPTLQEYLEKARNLKTRLILELKAHKTREQETRAVKKILKMVITIEMSGNRISPFVLTGRMSAHGHLPVILAVTGDSSILNGGRIYPVSTVC